MKIFFLTILFLILSVSSVFASNDSIIAQVNQIREAHRLVPVSEDSRLDNSATIKACDMVTNHYFSHYDLRGRNSFHLFIEQGYYYRLNGENLAIGYSDVDVVNAFMASWTHRIMILGWGYRNIGIGHCGKFTVLHFGSL